MSPRLKRALRWTLGTIGVLLVLVIGALYFLLSGEGAARRLIGFALEGNEGTVSISRVNGRLRSPLMLAGISFNLPKLRGTIDSVYIDWDLGALLGRRLSVNQLHAIGVRITVPDSTAPTPVDTVPPARLHLPVDVILGDVRIDSLSLQAPGNLALHEATARLTGRAEDFHLTASGTLTTPALDHSVPVALTARGDLDHIEMTPLSADLFGGRVNATGTVGWFPKVGWKLTVVADRLRPGLLLKDSTSLPGTASIFARTIGELDSIGPVGTVLVDSMNGALRRQPISGNANVHLAGPAYDISTLRMGWGSATLTTSGRVADTLALDYLLDVSTLSTLMPGASGTLEVKGRLTGPRQAGRTSATVSGRRLAYGTSRLARLDGRLALDLAPQGRDDLRVDGEHAAVGGKVIDRITLSLLGTRAQHRITLEGGAAFGSMDIVLTGGLAPDSGIVEWRGQVTTLALHNASAGEWTLERPAALVASADSVSLGMLCIAPNDSARAATMTTSASTDTTRGGLCAEGGAVMGVGWRVKGEVDQLPLALADSLLPGGRTMTGTVGGTFEAGVTGTRLTAEARLGLDRAALLYKSVRDTTPQRLALDTATLVLHAGSDGVRAVVRMQLAGTDSSAIGHLNADLTLPEYTTLGAPLGTQHFSTKVEARIDNLAFVRTLDAGVDSINGKLALDVSGDGTVRAPHLNGSMELTDFNAWMPNSRAAHGAVSATLASTVAQDRRVTAEFRIVPRAVFYDYTLGLLPRRIVVDSGGIEIKVGTDGVQGALALGLSDTSKTRLASVFGDVRMPKYVSLDFPLREQPITLKLDGDIPNLGFARAFMPGMDSLSGRLRLGMGVEGTLGTPAITGTLRLSELIARLAQGSLLTGNIDGDLKATVARDSTFSLDLRVVPRDFVLSPVTSKSRQRFTLGGSALDVQSHGQGVVGTLNFEVADTTGKSVASIAGKASLPELRKLGAPVDSGPIAAQLHGSIADLAFVEALVASVDSIAGQVRLDATADGTVGHPRVAGGLEIDNTAVRLPIA
ncbi:MAG: hypothetical protein ABJD11_17745, partial [Gemmatimonadota bacterium]